ncbi:MAG: SpoIIE family protein phosphatase [Bacteroidota bacterium]
MSEPAKINSRLEELESYAESLNILSEMGRLYNMTDEYDAVFKITAQYTPKIIPAAKRASIVLLDDHGQTFSVFALQGDAAIPMGRKIPLENTAIDKCISENKLISTSNISESGYADHELLAKAGMCCVINVPLIDGGSIFGTINIAGEKGFNWRDEQLLQKISAFLASTLSSRMLFNELQKAMYNIRQSIHYAKKIQTALLPDDKELSDLIPNHFLFNLPRDIVSGDFYWVREQNGKVFIAIGDCTGHGVPGAMMTALGINMLSQIVGEMKVEDPVQILNSMDVRLMELLRQTGHGGDHGVQDGMDFCLCVWDKHSDEILFAGAKRPLVIINEDGLKEIRGDKYPIGSGLYNKKTFTSHKVKIKKGDFIYLFSDGIIDQLGGDDMLRLGSKRFKECISKLHCKKIEDHLVYIENDFLKWKGSENQTDDIIILGFELIPK